MAKKNNTIQSEMDVQTALINQALSGIAKLLIEGNIPKLPALIKALEAKNVQISNESLIGLYQKYLCPDWVEEVESLYHTPERANAQSRMVAAFAAGKAPKLNSREQAARLQGIKLGKEPKGEAQASQAQDAFEAFLDSLG